MVSTVEEEKKGETADACLGKTIPFSNYCFSFFKRCLLVWLFLFGTFADDKRYVCLVGEENDQMSLLLRLTGDNTSYQYHYQQTTTLVHTLMAVAVCR